MRVGARFPASPAELAPGWLTDCLRARGALQATESLVGVATDPADNPIGDP